MTDDVVRPNRPLRRTGAKLFDDLPVGVSTLGAVLKKWRDEHPEEDAEFVAGWARGDRPEMRVLDADKRCPGCRGFGSVSHDVPVGHPEFGKGFSCPMCADQRKQEMATRILANAGLGRLEQYSRNSWVSIGNSADYLAKIDEWRKQCRTLGGASGLFLYGDVGRGKSWLASEALRSWIVDQATPAKFLSVPRWLQSLRPGNGTDDERAMARNTAMATPFIVLDDIGAERPTPWVLETIYQVVEERKNAQLPTVYTSNFDPDGLEILWATMDTEYDRIQGVRAAERIAEQCGNLKWAVEVSGHNLRRRVD